MYMYAAAAMLAAAQLLGCQAGGDPRHCCRRLAAARERTLR